MKSGEVRDTEKKPWWLGIATGAIIFWAEHMIRTEVNGIENLREAAEHVNSGKGGLFIAPNHNSFLDAELVKKVRDKVDASKRFVILWANKFSGKDKGKYAETGQEDMGKVLTAGKIGAEAARRVNIELVNVAQETTDFEAARKALNFLKEIGENVLGSDNVLVVFPEGTRSRDGKLHKGKKAMRMLFGNAAVNKNTLILPIAATGTGDYLPPDKEKPNLLAKVTITYGKPYTYEQAEAEMKRYNLPLEDILMWHIGQLLPEEKWGENTETFRKIRAMDVK